MTESVAKIARLLGPSSYTWQWEIWLAVLIGSDSMLLRTIENASHHCPLVGAPFWAAWNSILPFTCALVLSLLFSVARWTWRIWLWLTVGLAVVTFSYVVWMQMQGLANIRDDACVSWLATSQHLTVAR